MCHCVDLAIGGQQGRDEQSAAGQVLGVTKGGDRDIDPAAAAHEGGEIGRHHHGGDVLGLELAFLVPGVHAETLQHADQGLAGENGRIELVASAIEANDQPIANQLIVADTLDIGDILDAHLGRRRPAEEVQKNHGQGQKTAAS